MTLEKVEGIVLKSFDYQEHKRIFTLFTEHGLLSCVTTLSQKKSEGLLLSTPLSQGEFIYVVKNASLKTVKEGSLNRSYLDYKTSYHLLESATNCLQGILRSQLEGKPAPLLYKLLVLYLEKMPIFNDPGILSSSFLLKTLSHEGIFSLNSFCALCEKKEIRAFFKDLSYCKDCKIKEAIAFDDQEWDLIYILLHARDLSLLKDLQAEKAFHEKIKQFFDGFFS